MNNLLFILWNPDLYVFHLGSWGLRWYSTCWLIGLVGAYFMVKWLFSDQRIATRTIVKDGKKVEENVFDPLLIYCFLGILIGARLGHCLFYQRLLPLVVGPRRRDDSSHPPHGGRFVAVCGL